MNIYSVLQFIGGISFFLFGMITLSESLSRALGKRLTNAVRKAAQSRMFALFIGTVVTMLVQSSSAVTVMLVSLVGSGVLAFENTLFFIFGANIGTTFTAWLISLTGIGGSGLALNMLKPSNFSPVLALVGVILILVIKDKRKRAVGTSLIGFAVLMNGMEIMTDSVSSLPDNPIFTRILTEFSNPILALVAGAGITAILQSSSASVGILQAFANTGSISYSLAIPIVMGQNIGTCVSALISSIGGDAAAKRTALMHTVINILGALICFVPFIIFKIFSPNTLNIPVGSAHIAVIHTVFNIIMTLSLIPFSKQIIRFVSKIKK